MSTLSDRIAEVLHESLHATGFDYLAAAEAVEAELQPALGELEATKALLAATQELHSRTIADFCALRDALPRKQVEQILSAVQS